jgi:hypothetical protein
MFYVNPLSIIHKTATFHKPIGTNFTTMTGLGDPHYAYTHLHDLEPEQGRQLYSQTIKELTGSAERRHQAQYETAVRNPRTLYDAPHIPNFDLASINEIVQQPYPSPQMHMNSPSGKRRQTSTDQVHRAVLPKHGDPNVTSFMREPYAPTDVTHQGAPQRSFYQKDTQVSRNSIRNSDTTPTRGGDDAQLQTNSLSAYSETFYPSSPLQQQIQVSATTPNSRWAQAREYRRRVHQPPHIDARDDPTIAELEHDAELWVSELITAISNIENVKDTEVSHARRMFFPENLSPLVIEATSREIFTALMDRCKHGFRGPTSFNKALKPHKDSEADKLALCRERMENVVDVLAVNKRVCKDVLYEDWKIRLFVNHPLAYDKEKDSQKGSNDQRRLRLEREREKLRQTEEELRVVRDVKEAEASNKLRTFHSGEDATLCSGGKFVQGTHEQLDEEMGNKVKRQRV